MEGGCDVYTTKAAGGDKKLYKNIEKSLESQYASVLSFSASLSTQQAEAAGPSLNLSRASPFGSLSQISSRRTFAYLIATLNASHPDYDFSHLLRPSDFKREKSLKKIINTLDTTLYNLRPSSGSNDSFSRSLHKPYDRDWSPDLTTSTAPASPGPGTEKWNPRMWHLIDKEMSLKECSMYNYAPDEDPYDGEDGSLWSFSYFFFNKARKRVCYLYLRGISLIETSSGLKTPVSAYTPLGAGESGTGSRSKRGVSGTWSVSSMETAQKRARYWLGDRAGEAELVGDGDEDDEQENDNDKDRAEAGAEGSGRSTPSPSARRKRGNHAKDDRHAEHEHGNNEDAREGAGAGDEDGGEEDRHFLAFSSTDETGSQSPDQGRRI